MVFGRYAGALALLGCSLAGCARAERPDSATVRFDIPADPANLDPLFARVDAGGVDQTLARLAFEPFFDLDARGVAIPGLLAELPSRRNGGISADGRTITYRLRRGVRWSDGVAVTSRDVLFTIAAIRDPRNAVASHAGYELIDRAWALGPLVVRIHLSHAWAPAVATFFTYGANPQYVLPAHVLANAGPLDRAAFNAAPTVGDGPYAFVSWERGERLVYRANATYWRGRPRVARLDVRIVPDPQTNLTLLQSGALDFNLIAPAQQPALARQAQSISFAYAPTAIVAGIALETTHPPLDDARVRRAIAYAIDRVDISKKITLGRYPVAQSDRPRFSWAYDPAIAQPPYDVAEADRLLDAAGYRRGPGGMRERGGKELAFTYVQFPETTTGVRTAAIVQRELHDRGIDVTIKSISNAQLFLPASAGGTLAAGRFDLAYVPWAMGADPDDAFLLACGAGRQNYMRYCDPEIDRLEAHAAIGVDRAARRRDYAAIDRIVARDVPLVYLFTPAYVYAYRKRLEGFAPNAFLADWNASGWRVR